MRSPTSRSHSRLASDDDVVLPFLASANSNTTLYDPSTSPGGYFTYTPPSAISRHRSESDMSITHRLNPHFVHEYQLEDELGSGGYGFVMTARHRKSGEEVAVKFIIKSKVPSYAWMQHEEVGQLPTEVMLLCFLDHPNIVQCKDLFEDSLYYYLVQELHGSPWQKETRQSARDLLKVSASASPLPGLTASFSHESIASSSSSSPATPFQSTMDLASVALLQEPSPFLTTEKADKPADATQAPDPHLLQPARPIQRRRPSHDLFECIESSKQKRLPEDRARYVFAQVVDAVHYLDSQGVAHRDIKDENILIDSEYRVKLVDFGSASVIDPSQPRPFYTQFYGTTAYAASEILKKKKYQAAPAEVWTLGVLLSFLLTGNSPFPTVKEAVEGDIRLVDVAGLTLNESVKDLLRRCLDPDPKTRATIAEVKAHPWVTGDVAPED
ncbi:kinase-like domain-containing protein [Schizophyllum fasciatum]